ncbi:hypothetical protein VN97_g1376 [Penicillium thymicola]|uniref:Uncharacterized protein n=1 Tax=Penicillium thymicola TaxID=293382 RepID=A0AAI9TSF3_PENTH|nr:hypothetical protein VN97_g1376 [Penicillium thymicola]
MAKTLRSPISPKGNVTFRNMITCVPRLMQLQHGYWRSHYSIFSRFLVLRFRDGSYFLLAPMAFGTGHDNSLPFLRFLLSANKMCL